MAQFQNNAGVNPDDIKSGFDPVDEDSYETTLYEVETGVFKKEGTKNTGKPRLVATLKIVEGPFKGRQLKDFAIPLYTEEDNDWANRKAKEFFLTGLGLESFEDIPDDLDELLGTTVKVLVGIQKDNNERNEIKRYLKPDTEVGNGAGVLKEPAKAKAKPKPGAKL